MRRGNARKTPDLCGNYFHNVAQKVHPKVRIALLVLKNAAG